MTKTMKVARIYAYGSPAVLTIEEAPIPSLAADEVLIKNSVVGVNYGELLQRQGVYPIPVPLPAILGSEVAGTVVAVGHAVREVEVGERVCGLLLYEDGNWKSNGYAEYGVVKAAHTIRIPPNVSEDQALGLLAQGLTAYLMLTQSVPTVKNKSVTITGASGGVGNLAIQLAHLLGAKQVMALTAKPNQRTHLEELGATDVISTRSEEWAQAILGATQGMGTDIFLDAVGGVESKKSLSALASFGRLVAYGFLSGSPLDINGAEMGGLIFNNQSVTGFANMAYFADAALLRHSLERLFGWAAQGKLMIRTTAFGFEDIAQAHQAMEERKTEGKVVVRLQV